MVDWNDWRFFLAVARSGSTLAAARALRVSQTTVARRIATLEALLNLILFERRPAGYALTADGAVLVSHAEAVEQSAMAAETRARAAGRSASGTIRITAEDIFINGLISHHLVALQEAYPAIRVELDSTPGLRDLGAGDADIALRSLRNGDQPDLTGWRLCPDEWTLYCSRGYVARNGLPQSIEALRNHAIVGGGGGQLGREYAEWLDSAGLSDKVRIAQASATGLLAAARDGLGIAVLPSIVADLDPSLVKCLPAPPEQKRSLWLLTHERSRRQPAVRAVLNFLHAELTRHLRGCDQATAA